MAHRFYFASYMLGTRFGAIPSITRKTGRRLVGITVFITLNQIVRNTESGANLHYSLGRSLGA